YLDSSSTVRNSKTDCPQSPHVTGITLSRYRIAFATSYINIMEIVLVLLVLVAVVLALVVLSRLSGVVKGLKLSAESHENAARANSVNGWMFLIVMIIGGIAITWSYLLSTEFYLPEASSVHGRRTDDLFWFSMGILTIPFVLVNATLFVFAWKYRYKKGKRAVYYPENHRLELVWTAIPAIVMAILVLTGWKAWSDITSEAPEDAEVIEITGKQFGWIARYGGVD